MTRNHIVHGIPGVPNHSRWRRAALAAAVFLVTLIVFLPSLNCGFVNWDDDEYVYRNPVVLGGLSPSGIRRACTEVVFCNWAPLTILSYQLDATLFGRQPWGFHLTNVLCHAVAVTVLYVALQRMTGRPGRSALAALFFALHPLRVESVAWIAERKDVLSVLFVALAMLAYDWYCRRPGPWRYGLVCAALLASLLSKATAVTLPVLLLLLDVWPMGRLTVPGVEPTPRGDGTDSPYPSRSWTAAIAEKLPLLALAFIFAVVTLKTQGDAIQPENDMPFWNARLPNALHATAWYVVKTFWPSGLHPAYWHAGADGRPLWLVVCCAAACAGLACIAAVSARRLPAVTFGIVWFVASLLPVLGLVAQQGFQSHADRFTYVPHIGLVVAVVFSFAELTRRLAITSTIALPLAAAVAVALVGITVRQIGIWRDGRTLWHHTLAVDDTNFVAMYSFATLLRETGEPDAAIRQLERALTCWPAGTAPARISLELGLAYLDAGRPVEAAKEFEATLAKEPGNWKAKNGLGVSWLHRGEPQRALDCFEQALRLQPDDPDAIHNAMLALVALGRLDDAAIFCRRLISIDPAAVEPRSRLGQILLRLGRIEPAIRELESALRLDPTSTALQTVLAEAHFAAGSRERAAAIARAALTAAPEPLAPAIRQRLERVVDGAMAAP